MKIIYMGTPDFAVNALESIIKAGHDVVAVFSQPDKAKGRSKALVATPVKQKALEYDIPVYQPEKARNEESVELIRNINPDAIVVAAYGQILPESILNIPRYGCINIHASLLPKYRGAAPIEWSIINGDKKTGVTTMYMAKGIDTGASLRSKLAELGATLILSTLTALEKGTATRTKQIESESTHVSMLNKEMGKIDFTKSAEEIERLMRGLNPWPCAYTTIDGKSVKLFRAVVVDKEGVPGQIIEVNKKDFVIACGSKALLIKNLQPEGKKPMDTVAFLNGNKIEVGMMVG